nr:hypothetical protein GCM10020093_065460 [Planobispora longispora]
MLDELLRSSLVIMILIGIVALVLGYLVADRALRPLDRVTETAQRLSESTLHERIALRGPHDEVKRLADTFDAMLDRLHRVFDGQRRFIANASHELRTPWRSTVRSWRCRWRNPTPRPTSRRWPARCWPPTPATSGSSRGCSCWPSRSRN